MTLPKRTLRNSIHSFTLLLFFLIINCSSQTQTISGKVYITGNVPFQKPALMVSQDEIYLLSGKNIQAVTRLQGKTITVKAKFKHNDTPDFRGILEIKYFTVTEKK